MINRILKYYITFKNDISKWIKFKTWQLASSSFDFCLFRYILDFAHFKATILSSGLNLKNHKSHLHRKNELGPGPSMNNDGIKKMRFILFNLFAWFLKWRLIKLILRKLILYNTKHFQYYLKAVKIVIFGKNGNFELNFGIQRPIRRKWEKINV